jgi:hypothetical protein
MANEEQLAILKQGVEVWNKWRWGHHRDEIDLGGADLHNSTLQGVYFDSANLRGADLHGANLRNAYLVFADLTEANLSGADVSGANLAFATLTGANLSDTNLTGAHMAYTDLREADLRRSNLWGANLTDAQLVGANLRGADIETASFNRVRVRESEGVFPVLEDAIGPESPDYEKPGPDEVSFTAIYPREGKVETWHTLLVYAHLMSAMGRVYQDAERFKDQIRVPKKVTSTSATPIVRGTKLTIVPSCDGVIFNPERVVVKWMEDYHRADFRFRADKSLANDAAKGQINIFVGPLIVGTLKLAMLLNETNAQIESDHTERGRMYHQEDIFVSYSHKDSDIVLACKKAYEALGFNVLIDIDTLRSGQDWNEELMRMIDRATVFQLFWSQNSSRSKYCQQEWEHALKRNKEGFIRPIFWETPRPDPPEELSRYHFEYVQF